MIMGEARLLRNRAIALTSRLKYLKRQRKSFGWEKCPHAMVINGDATDLDLLKEEGIQNTDAFIAVTSNSEANILACLAAKRFGVKKTVAEVENIDYIMLAQSMDIGTVINKKVIAAGYIYQLTLDADVLMCARWLLLMLKWWNSLPRRFKDHDQNQESKLPENVNIGDTAQ